MSKIEDAHDDGQKDGAKNVYNPPKSPGFVDVILHPGSVKEELNEIESYRSGWDNGFKQRK